MMGTYLSIVLGAGLSSGLMRFFFEKKEESWQKKVFTSAVTSGLLITTLITILVMLISWLVAQKFDFVAKYQLFIFLTTIAVGFESFITMVLTLYRLEDKAFKYLRLNMLRLLVAVPANIIFIAFLEYGVLGFILSNVLSALAVIIFYVIPTVFKLFVVPDIKLIRSLFRFSLPYIPTAFLEAFVNNMAIIALSFYGHTALIGLFAIGNKIAGIISYLGMPIGIAWTPQMYKMSKQPDAQEVYGRVTVSILVGMSFFVVYLILFANDIMKLLTTEAFSESVSVVIPLTLGYWLYNMRPSVRIGLALKNKTKYFPYLTIAPLILTAPVVFYFAKEQNIIGVSLGIGLTMILIVILTAMVSLKFLHINYQYYKLIKLFVAVSVFLIIPIIVPISETYQKIIYSLIYPVMLYLSGVISQKTLSSVFILTKSDGTYSNK